MAHISLIPLKLLTDFVALLYSLNTNVGTFQQKLIGTFLKNLSIYSLSKQQQQQQKLVSQDCYAEYSS